MSEQSRSGTSQPRKERMIALDALKAMGIVMVVAVHALVQVEVDQATYEQLSFLFGAAAVPVFFLADGFLLSWKWTAAEVFDYPAYIRKSAKRLLIPWAVFTGVYLVVRLVAESYGLTKDTILLGRDLLSVGQVIYLSGESPHMYFLLSLFMLRAGACVFVPMLKWPISGWGLVAVAYAIAFQTSHPKNWFLPGADPLLLAGWGLQFYGLGIVLQKSDGVLRPYAAKLCAIGGALTIALKSMELQGTGIILQMSYIGTIYFFLQISAERFARVFSALGRETMGIYILHAPIIVWIVAACVERVFPFGSLPMFVLTTGLTVAISWGITRLLNRTRLGGVVLGTEATVHHA